MVNSVDLTSFPTARNDATESSYAKIAEAYLTNGVIWNVGSEFACFADSTGMHVKVPSGRGVVNGTYGESTSTQTLDIATADASHARIDRVVLRLTATSPATVSLHVLTGIAASSPAAPTLANDGTQVDSPIAQIAVGAAVSTITSTNVTTERQMTGDTGWQNFTCTPLPSAGSSFSIPFWTQSWAHYRCREMTCEINVGGSIGLSGSNPGSLMLPLPFRATTNGLVLAADIANDARRCVTTFDSNFLATYALASPIGSGIWPITSGLPLYFGGSFQLFAQ